MNIGQQIKDNLDAFLVRRTARELAVLKKFNKRKKQKRARCK